MITNGIQSSHTVVVLIFAHKPQLEPYEVIGLQQCFRILGRHPIRLVCPAHLDVSAYTDVVRDLRVDRIPAQWLASYRSYNRLKMLPFLYRRYARFEFLLTYELDAFVFRDELLDWCAEGWDYIGAPWFDGYDKALPHARPVGVGNSGFSLRRIATMLRVSTSLRYRVAPHELVGAWRRREVSLMRLIASLTFRNNFFGAFNDYRGQEDFFWCQIVPSRFGDVRIAPYERARHFAFEANPSRLFRECGEVLPFGCHKWNTYEPAFWKRHVERYGYTVSDGTAS